MQLLLGVFILMFTSVFITTHAAWHRPLISSCQMKEQRQKKHQQLEVRIIQQIQGMSYRDCTDNVVYACGPFLSLVRPSLQFAARHGHKHI